MNDFGENLMKVLEEKGLTRADISRELGISKPTVSSYVSGKSDPTIPVLTKLSKYLDVSVEFLIFGDENIKDDIEKQLIETFRELDYENKVEAVSSVTSLLVKQKLLNKE